MVVKLDSICNSDKLKKIKPKQETLNTGCLQLPKPYSRTYPLEF